MKQLNYDTGHFIFCLTLKLQIQNNICLLLDYFDRYPKEIKTITKHWGLNIIWTDLLMAFNQLPVEFLEFGIKYGRFGFENISLFQEKLPEHFVIKYIDKLHLPMVLRTGKYSEAFLEQIIMNRNDMYDIVSKYQKLSQRFISKWIDFLTPDILIERGLMTEKNLKKCLHRVENTDLMCCNVKLSKEFILENRHFMSFSLLKKYQKHIDIESIEDSFF